MNPKDFIQGLKGLPQQLDRLYGDSWRNMKTSRTITRYNEDKYLKCSFTAYENMKDLAMDLENDLKQAREIAEKYRDLDDEMTQQNCINLVEKTLLPWEKQ